MPSSAASPPCRLLWVGFAVLLGSCREEPVRVYHVAAEAGAEEGEAADAGALDHGHGAAVKWTRPEAWTELEADESRLGHYSAPGGDGSEAAITVIRLDGTAGGTLANVNRWRGQVKLEPIAEESLASTRLPTTAGGGEFEIFEIDGGEAGAMLAAQLPMPGETWFFKMTGSAAAVAAQKENFLSLLASVEVAGGAAGGGEAAPPFPEVAAPALEVPEGWEKSEGSRMRLASFRVTGSEGRMADISVVSLKGDGGGFEPNLNLWRTQMQLRDLTADELSAGARIVRSGLGDLSLVHFESTEDLLGEGRKAAIVGAIGQVGGRTWFFKMAGDLDVVAAEKERFIRFIETAAPR